MRRGKPGGRTRVNRAMTEDCQAHYQPSIIEYGVPGTSCRKVHTGPGRSQVANEFSSRYDKRGDQSACPISDVVLLTSLGLAGHSRLCGVGTAQCLHSRLFITANHQSTLLVHHGSLDVQLANLLCLGVEVGVVAVEPVNTPVRFQVGLFKNPPDCRPTHGQSMIALVDQVESKVIQRPPGGRTILFAGRTAGQSDHIESFRGGKSVAVVPTAARPGGQPIPSKGSGCATARRCGAHSGIRQQFEDSVLPGLALRAGQVTTVD